MDALSPKHYTLNPKPYALFGSLTSLCWALVTVRLRSGKFVVDQDAWKKPIGFRVSVLGLGVQGLGFEK